MNKNKKVYPKTDTLKNENKVEHDSDEIPSFEIASRVEEESFDNK